MFRSAQHDRGIGVGRVLCALYAGCPVWAIIHSVKFKNDFAVAFALRGMCDRGFDFA